MTRTIIQELLIRKKYQNNDSVAKEQLTAPVFTKEHFIMALHNFRKIDVTKQDGKRKIIDAFINSIYLYDDHMKIVYNANGKEEVVSLEDLESSTLFSSGAPAKTTGFPRRFFSTSSTVSVTRLRQSRTIAIPSLRSIANRELSHIKS